MGRSGTGLGMVVVWGTVRDHKGHIDVKSDEGTGTLFELYFPVTRQQFVREESQFFIDDYFGNGESVLVVDDIKEQRELAYEMLKSLKYRVTTLSSGEDAVEYIKKNRVELLLLDMIMDPGIDGLDTYKRILKIRPNQKAIIVSGYSETDRVREARKLGVGSYIKKPYLMEKIARVVKDELDKG